MTKKLVSVIITTYKRAEYLNRAIESVLNQTYKNIEIIIVDDNSEGSIHRENTEKIMKKYDQNKKIIYIKHKTNKNGANARNTGIKYSTGDYLTYLDDDDWYKPEKIQRQVEFLEEENYDAVYCGWNKDGLDETPLDEGNLAFEILSGKLLIRTNTIMMRKDISNKIGNWDGRFRRNQEAAYLLNFFMNGGKIGVVPEVLVIYDSSDRSNASNPIKSEEDFRFLLSLYENNLVENNIITAKEYKVSYVKRIFGVALNYFKNRNFFRGGKLLIILFIDSPVLFLTVIFNYIKDRIC